MKYARGTPNQKEKNVKKLIKTRNMKTIIGVYPLEKVIEKEIL
jgi:hypothetical protein